MASNAQKLYCFVDESGQDTHGELFLVSVILQRKEQLIVLREKLEEIEKMSGKRTLKWLKTSFTARLAYLEALFQIKELKDAVYYSIYRSTKEYQALISLTIAKSIAFTKIDQYEATIIIDGLNAVETDRVRRELKNLRVRYRKIRGMRDEQEILLRLADSMVGFLRDCAEEREYTKKLLTQFLQNKIIIKV